VSISGVGVQSVAERGDLDEAREAYRSGALEQCLAACDLIECGTEKARVKLALLRARVHVRMDRGDRALDALRALTAAHLEPAEELAVSMLTGAAYVRLGQSERGAEILSAVLKRAGPADANLRAEIAVHLGIARVRLGSLDEAEALLSAIGPEHDVIYAHALEYLGWIGQMRSDFPAAADHFRSALAVISGSRTYDRYIEAKSLYGLTALCPELFATEEWPLIERRVRRFDWSLEGLGPWPFWVNIAASMMCETVGDVANALRWAHAARSRGGDAYSVVALCRLAATLRGVNEVHGHLDALSQASELYECVNLRNLPADLQNVSLYLAEEVIHTGAADTAEALLAQHRDIMTPRLSSPGTDFGIFSAMERSIEGLISLTRGEKSGLMILDACFEIFARLGYRRRATAIALRLARATNGSRYGEYAAAALAGVSPQFWMKRHLDELRTDPGPLLTPAETHILQLLVKGLTYKEIAAERGVTWKTISIQVQQALFRKFSVRSRGELVAEALRRRIAAPPA